MQLLPLPRHVEPSQGSFTFAPDDAISGDRDWAAIVRRLLAPGTGLELPHQEDGRIVLTADSSLGREAYELTVEPDRIRITAADERGVNWATQTLRQLLPATALLPAPGGEALTVPAVHVADRPRFGWRGVHLDVARHFVPIADLFRFVDLLALHKLNVVHLHLTDDQGWRFESLRHPRLQEVASWRSQTHRPVDAEGDGTPHGGFYRQDQLRALVAYAGQRGIDIVPELDFPGHVRALLAAYPELGNHPENPLPTATGFGIFTEVLRLDDDVMAVVFDLFAELIDVFPSRYVHIGGDECPTDDWESSPAAVQLAAGRGLTGSKDLQRWFTLQLNDWLTARGRVLVGWDEIVDAGPVDGAVAMAWREREYGVQAARLGMDVVMAPARYLYFNYYGDEGAGEPYAIPGPTVPLRSVHAFDPVAELTEAEAARVLGVQAAIWTEYLPTARQVDYALFPRACALAEIGWSAPDGRDWAEFEPRLARHLERLDVLGVNFRPLAGPRPWQQGGTGRLRRPADSTAPVHV